MRSNCFHLGGQIKVYPEDFIVEEVWEDRVFTVNVSFLNQIRDRFSTSMRGNGDYIHFTLVKRDWTTMKAMQYMARNLHVSLKRFGYSGMKDKRALCSQRVSAWRIRADDIMNLRFKDIWIKDLSYADERITLGNASGNRFTVTIRSIFLDKTQIQKILKEFKESVMADRIPNFFGPQRLEGGNVAIGQAIVNGDLKLAAEILLEKVQPYIKEIGIEGIPDSFWIEKNVLLHLLRHPNDYAGALRKIPKRLLTIFPYAVQSQIFNDALKEAISKGKVPETLIINGFPVHKMPELNTRPILRRTYLNVKDFHILAIGDRIAKIRFTLGKGEYATTLLSHLIGLKL